MLADCDQRATCATLAAPAAWLVRLCGGEKTQVLMGGLRKAAQGQAVRLVSDGHWITEAAREQHVPAQAAARGWPGRVLPCRTA